MNISMIFHVNTKLSADYWNGHALGEETSISGDFEPVVVESYQRYHACN